MRKAHLGRKEHFVTAIDRLTGDRLEGALMHRVTNYDGGITATPQQLVRPASVEELQAILKDTTRFPGPVRPMGSYHSLTPCASSDGTIVDMKGLRRIIAIDPKGMTLTAQAGLEWIDASRELRKQNLQFMTNIEIGNMTLGSAACCHTKDGLDGIEFGQVSSYVTKIRWVTPSGAFAEASEDGDPQMLHMMRSSYGLAGIIYEVTIRIKPLEVNHFAYLPRRIAELTEKEVDDIISRSEGLVCWTLGNTTVFQSRTRAETASPLATTFANTRRRLWSRSIAHISRTIDVSLGGGTVADIAHRLRFGGELATFRALRFVGGWAIQAPDKTIDYRTTPESGKYAFTFWTFPRAAWLSVLRAYVEFADQHFRTHGFRCNMPLGSYFVRKDTNNLLSYSYDGDTFSIDPIHAYSDRPAWDRFLREFNEFCHKRNGIPLFNQSPFITREHVHSAYGERWQKFSDWVKREDPAGRMRSQFFADLLI